MAKIGEGDPRWIVSERSDGTNIGNWHWTEKNMMPWVSQQFPKYFDDLTLFEEGNTSLKVTSVDTIKGEANINTRKGKTFHIYELEIKLKWKGKFEGEAVEGTIFMPEVSFEYTPDDFEMKISVTTGSQWENKLRAIMANHGLPVCRRKLGEFLDVFKAQKGELKEVKEVSLSASKQAEEEKIKKEGDVIAQQLNTTAARAHEPKSASNMATIEFTEKFRASTHDIWLALTDVGRVQAYTQSPAQIELRVGGRFSMFHDNITGEYTEVVPDEKLSQTWRNSSWPQGHSSSVTLTFKKDEDGMTLHLKQTNVPVNESDRTQGAWRENMFERIKRMFGYGGGLSF